MVYDVKVKASYPVKQLKINFENDEDKNPSIEIVSLPAHTQKIIRMLQEHDREFRRSHSTSMLEMGIWKEPESTIVCINDTEYDIYGSTLTIIELLYNSESIDQKAYQKIVKKISNLSNLVHQVEKSKRRSLIRRCLRIH